MRPFTSTSPPIRLPLMKAGTAVLLWLLSVSVSSAAHTPRHLTRRLCDPQRTSLRQLPRKPVSYGGPLMRPSVRVLAGLSDPMARMTRVTRQALSDDEEAIQNDAPAAHLVVDLILELRPLGLFVDVFDQRPRTGTFSPRAPRGPPLPA
jgi:hypothetical protein